MPDRDTLGTRTLSLWRERILRALLLSICVLGVVAYVPSVWLSARDGYWSIVVLDTVAYAWIVFVTWWPRASYRLQAISITTIAFLLGAALIIQVGVPGAGLFWLATAPVLLALLGGLRAAIVGIGILALLVLALAAGIAAGVFDYAPRVLFPDGGLIIFLVGAANAVLLSAAMALSGATLLRALEQSNTALEGEIDERRRLEAELIDAHRLEAVGRLAGGIAHDFNNLLVPILAHADDLRRLSARDSLTTSRLDDIVLSAERGRDLVQRLLAFSGRRVTAHVVVSLNDVARDATRLLRAALPANVDVRLQVPTDHVTVLADPVELHQVLMNLGTNAGHAMKSAGGVLTLTLASPDEGTAVLRVTDTGVGMSPEVLQRATEPFFTTRRAGEGSGIGLATVQAITGSINGELHIESTEGVGTSVTVRLRRHATPPPEEAPRPTEATHPPQVPVSAWPRRAVVVDDEELVLRVSSMALRRLGFDVVALDRARDALAYLTIHARTVDFFVTDRAMPDMDGLELAAAVHAIDPTLPIVLASGFVDDETVSRASQLGVVHVMPKPFRAADLEEAVQITGRYADDCGRRVVAEERGIKAGS